MTPLKNARRERFCQELAKGQPQRRAYIDAGYKTVKNDATDAAAAKLAAVPEVRDRIRELQQTSAKDVGVTVDSLLQEAERARQLAEDAKQPSAMVAATTLKAKISASGAKPPWRRSVPARCLLRQPRAWACW